MLPAARDNIVCILCQRAVGGIIPARFTGEFWMQTEFRLICFGLHYFFEFPPNHVFSPYVADKGDFAVNQRNRELVYGIAITRKKFDYFFFLFAVY
jgi:hypothetical protein